MKTISPPPHARYRKGPLLASLSLLLLVGQVVSAATKTADELTGTVAGDPVHDMATVVELWTDSATATFAVTPGLYDLTMLGRFIGPYNTRYSVKIVGEMNEQRSFERHLWSNQLGASDSYQPATYPLVITSDGTLTLSLSLDDHALEEDAKAVEAQRMQALAKAEAAAMENRDAAVEEEGGDDIEGLDDDRPPPSGTESFLLSTLTLERRPTTIVVTHARPDKLHYFPKEKAELAFTLKNFSPNVAKGKVQVQLIRDIDRAVTVLEEDVSLPPGEQSAQTVSHQLDGLYGYEMRVTVSTVAGTHQVSEYFGVSENVFELSLQGWGAGLGGVANDQEFMRNMLSMPQEKLDAKADAAAEFARVRYYNHSENFSWAPDDFFNLSPAEDVWWSGTMTYIKVKRVILAKIRAMQKHGIKVLTYAQPFAIGLDTVQELRTNPEFFAYYGRGAPAVSYDYDLIKSRSRMDMGLRPMELGGGLNFFDLRTVDRGIDAIIASHKMFGWDGVRYDNRYYRANNPLTYTGKRATTETNLDPYSARNVKRQKDRFREEIGPRFLISHNNGYNFHTEDNKLGWRETVKDGLMCMDEETCNANEGGSAINPIKTFIDFGTEARRFCTELGGYYQLFPPGRGQAMIADMLYYAVACLASGSHPITCDMEFSPAGNYGRFLTRYSQYVFADDIKPLADADNYASISGDGSYWWQDWSNELHKDGKRYLLFPLVVPPSKARMGTNPDGLITATKAGDVIQLKSAQFATKPRVMLLSGERHLPMQQELPVGENWQVSLPRIAHFALVLVESEVPQ